MSTIESSCFRGCILIPTMDMSTTSIQTISSYAFYGCTALSEIKLPASLTKIESNAFRNCNNLHTIYCNATTPPNIVSTTSF